MTIFLIMSSVLGQKARMPEIFVLANCKETQGGVSDFVVKVFFVPQAASAQLSAIKG
jgi:hypothetical protein